MASLEESVGVVGVVGVVDVELPMFKADLRKSLLAHLRTPFVVGLLELELFLTGDFGVSFVSGDFGVLLVEELVVVDVRCEEGDEDETGLELTSRTERTPVIRLLG